MNIFIGFGYNANDEWIKKLVIPLVETFDANVITGEDIPGQVLSAAVAERIQNSDGFLGFFTRRDALANGTTFTSHQWVRDELVTAINNRIPAVEIREKKVDPQGGIIGDRQRLEFDQDDKAPLLVELAKLLSTWRRNLKSRRLLLLPDEIVKDARPHINKDTLTCNYQFKYGNKDSPAYKAKPFKSGQALCIDIRNVPSEDALVQITIQGPGFEWSSGYEPVHLLLMNLQKN